MLCKIKHNETNKIEEFIKLSSLFMRETFSGVINEDNISELIKFNNAKVISAEIKEKIYSYYLINYENNSIGIISLKEDKDAINIYQIFILKKYRKQGIAYNAISELKKEANINNIEYLKIFVTENNKKLPKIVEKWGFKKSENSARYVGNNIYIYENTYILRIHVK